MTMSAEELLRRLNNHEDNFTERKPDKINAAQIRQTLVAFANSVPEGREAILFIGVHDDGRILGCSNPDSMQKTVRRVSEQDCYPRVTFTSEVINGNPGPVLAVIVPHSASRPHFSGPAYVRRGSESVVASEQLFNELVYARNSTAAAILKLKNEVVLIVGLGHRLGTSRRDVARDYREGGEARILECNSQTVRLEMLATGLIISEPLDHVKITFNEAKHKAELVVTGF